MGGKSSKNSKAKGGKYSQSTSSCSNNQYGGYPSQPSSSTPAYGAQPPKPQKKLEKRYSRIADNYNSLEQVTQALSSAGLESSNLIVGIDFTKSNEWTGSQSFNGKSLHHISDHSLNPYEHAISIIGKTLADFDEDNLIPCYGFGDATTHAKAVFSFYHEDRFCNGFEDVLSRYREIVPHLNLSGPTSFAPVIEQAMTIVDQSGGQYHVLLIIADGQVGHSEEKKTIETIVKASKLPLSIVLVGVGDGPWGVMKEFDDNIPNRDFDNFQFVNFTEIMSKTYLPSNRKETEFALSALMEIPSQYKATIELNLLGNRRGILHQRAALPPPVGQPSSSSCNTSTPSQSTTFQNSGCISNGQTSQNDTSASISKSTNDDQQLCPVCLTNMKNMAFGCGHQTCHECGESLQLCPICRASIETRIKLF
ncbi:unnamed protein product [Lactuca virosa]|uniref:RING-type domain-containing protein n=1 Tax=Lactuca virosa TaxID=75947 RepID=A0AAU9LTD9_9ASTR|nr:unnamed protein product [Lactuca virosa]